MIFYPMEPRKFFGLITWQGLFLKRRRWGLVDEITE